MMKFEQKRDVELSSPVSIGDRLVYVVSERLVMSAGKNRRIFGMLISPIYIVVVEGDLLYAFSIVSGVAIELEDLFLKHPALREKLHLPETGLRNPTPSFDQNEEEDSDLADGDQF